MVAVYTCLPLISMVTTALAPIGSQPQGLSWPRNPHWGNFATAWNDANLLHLLGSSLLIVLGVVPAAVLFSTLAGYGFATHRLPAGRLLFALFLIGLAVPLESLITPLYYQSRTLGTFESRWAVVLPLIGIYMSFGVFWMTTQFRAIPRELREAARIDGASDAQILRQVYLPLARSGVAAMGILYFLWTWNQFLLPLVLISDPQKRNMAGALGAFQTEYGTNIVLLCSASVLTMLPSLAVYILLQRQFINAILQGGMK
ncbi:MAG: carbohydrate ABC transporter permease [Nocardioides sp.]